MKSHRRLQIINGPSLGLARLMEQNFVTFLWVGKGGGGGSKWRKQMGTLRNTRHLHCKGTQ